VGVRKIYFYVGCILTHTAMTKHIKAHIAFVEPSIRVIFGDSAWGT